MDRTKATELATVMRTLKDERLRNLRDPHGNPHPDDTSVALGEAQRHFQDLADEADA